MASAQDWAKTQVPGRNQHNAKGNATLHYQSEPLSTVADRAAQSCASIRTQKMADKVAKAAPDLARHVAHGGGDRISLRADNLICGRAQGVKDATLLSGAGKLREAVCRLATREGEVRKRLKAAHWALRHLSTEELPPELRDEWQSIMRRLTRHGFEVYDGEVFRDAVTHTMSRIKNSTGRLIATNIHGLYSMFMRTWAMTNNSPALG